MSFFRLGPPQWRPRVCALGSATPWLHRTASTSATSAPSPSTWRPLWQFVDQKTQKTKGKVEQKQKPNWNQAIWRIITIWYNDNHDDNPTCCIFASSLWGHEGAFKGSSSGFFSSSIWSHFEDQTRRFVLNISTRKNYSVCCTSIQKNVFKRMKPPLEIAFSNCPKPNFAESRPQPPRHNQLQTKHPTTCRHVGCLGLRCQPKCWESTRKNKAFVLCFKGLLGFWRWTLPFGEIKQTRSAYLKSTPPPLGAGGYDRQDSSARCKHWIFSFLPAVFGWVLCFSFHTATKMWVSDGFWRSEQPTAAWPPCCQFASANRSVENPRCPLRPMRLQTTWVAPLVWASPDVCPAIESGPWDCQCPSVWSLTALTKAMEWCKTYGTVCSENTFKKQSLEDRSDWGIRRTNALTESTFWRTSNEKCLEDSLAA